MSNGTQTQKGRVLKAVVNYGIGGTVPKVVNFLLLPLYTVYIEPDGFGKLEVFFGAQVFLLVLMRGGFPSALARLVFDELDEEAFRDLVLTSLVTAMALAGLGSAVFVLGFPWLAGRVFALGDVSPWIELTALGACGQLLMEFQRRLLQAKEESALAAKLGASQAVLTTVVTLALVLGLDFGAIGVMYGSVASTTVFGGVGLVYLMPYVRAHFRIELLRRAASYGLPLVPHHLFAAIHQYAGRWVLAAVATVTMTGHLGFAGRLTSPLVMLTGAFAAAYSPVYFSWRSQKTDDETKAESRRVGTSLVSLGAVVVIGIALGAVVLVRFFVAESYLPALVLVGPMAIAQYLQLIYAFVIAELFYVKRTRIIPVVFAATAAVNLVALFFLVPRWGSLGAVYAQILGSVVSLGLASLLAGQTFPVPLAPRALIAAVIGCAAACVAVAWLPHWDLGWTVLVTTTVMFALIGTTLVAAGSARSVLEDGLWLFEQVRLRLAPKAVPS